jgi:hypothetical protein
MSVYKKWKGSNVILIASIVFCVSSILSVEFSDSKSSFSILIFYIQLSIGILGGLLSVGFSTLEKYLEENNKLLREILTKEI